MAKAGARGSVQEAKRQLVPGNPNCVIFCKICTGTVEDPDANANGQTLICVGAPCFGTLCRWRKLYEYLTTGRKTPAGGEGLAPVIIARGPFVKPALHCTSIGWVYS
jgi:hypothetical protein